MPFEFFSVVLILFILFSNAHSTRMRVGGRAVWIRPCQRCLILLSIALGLIGKNACLSQSPSEIRRRDPLGASSRW